MGIAGGPWRVETGVNPGKPTDCRRPWSLSEIIKTNFLGSDFSLMQMLYPQFSRQVKAEG